MNKLKLKLSVVDSKSVATKAKKYKQNRLFLSNDISTDLARLRRKQKDVGNSVFFRVDKDDPMIIGIHQPHFLPWLGYFNKVWHSQIFVWLNTVQYRKNYYQNRTKIKNVNEQWLWLTLPVHVHLGVKIDSVTIADIRWRERVQNTIKQCYRKTPFFDAYWPILEQAVQDSPDNLDKANFVIFKTLLTILNAEHIQVVRANEINVLSSEPTGRLVEICQHLGGDAYIAGQGGRNYMDVEQFERAGIKILWQAFNPANVVYPQIGKSFLCNLSIIDCLFNAGSEKTREILQTAWQP